MSDPKPPVNQRNQTNEIDLTPDDEAALDRAWESITEAEMEASITWIHQQQQDKQDKEQKHHG